LSPDLLYYAVIWKEQVELVVGAASSRDHLISRLEAAPTWGLSMGTWTLQISIKNKLNKIINLKNNLR
jgi:hypothetical protein